MIIPSDLNTDENVKYNVEGRDLTAQEFRDEYERTIAESIEDSIKEMLADLKTSVIKDDANNIKLLIKKITNAVKDRNRICKANKV
jgi:wobble nucleotide-excising tRNase